MPSHLPFRDPIERRSLILIALLLATLVAFAALMQPVLADSPAIVVDGQRLPADVPAVVDGDHVLVPLRGVFERFGADVSFDATNDVAIASLRGTVVKVSLKSPDGWINGEHRTLDIGARELAGRVLIPVRFVADALGVAVEYDAQRNTVVIVSGFRAGSFAAAGSGETSNFSMMSAPKQAPRVEDESPRQGELIGSQYPQIYARLAGGTSAVNPGSVSVTVDGQDVTGSSTISSAYVSYTPQYGLQTGEHTVEINGAADDGTPFSDSWTFRVDAGSGSLYNISAVGGNGVAGGFGGGFFGGGFNPFFHRFGFFPPGFSVFTPGPLFFPAGGVIEVVFFSRFFTSGNCFFNISGIPGSFALTPWPGNPGFFWGFMTVPFGATSHRAVIAAHFGMPGGRNIVVHSTAPLEIDGLHTHLPATLRYAVLPRIISKPTSPHHLVVFRRIEPRTDALSVQVPGSQLRVFRGNGDTITIRSLPVDARAAMLNPVRFTPSRRMPLPEPVIRPALIRPRMAPVIRPLTSAAPVLRPLTPAAPAMLTPWQFTPRAMPAPRPMPVSGRAKPH